MSTSYLEGIFSLFQKYSSLPLEAVIKQDILRQGISFSLDFLKIASGYKPKDYFIFSFDLIEIEKMENKENLKAPEEIRFHGGEYNLLPTVVSVRVNPDSVWKVELSQGKLVLSCQESEFCEVSCHPLPPFYEGKVGQKKISEIAPVLEWGYLIYLTVYRLCDYFTKKEQCRFCDLNRNYQQQKKAGRKYTGIKSVDEIIQALELIDTKDVSRVTQAITITGGAVLKELQNETEVSFYARYARAIRDKFSQRWIVKAVVQAFEKEECRFLRDSGVKIYHPNFEVWDKNLFEKLCPGKARVIGRDLWMKRILESAEIFGEQMVIPNFVAGVEMNRNFGYQSVQKAVDSTAEGLEFFMSKKIMPRFTTWCPEPFAALGPQPAPPLEYYCLLLERFRDIFRSHKLPDPEGYGPVGVGKAVFSVSAFMDVL